MIKRYRRGKQGNKPIIYIIAFSLVFLFSIGYASFGTTINISGKGNIGAQTAADVLRKNVVTSGDGLYVDSTEDGRYVYKGANPDNYIKLENDMYRIVAIEPDNTFKVIKQGSIGKIMYDLDFDSPELIYEGVSLNDLIVNGDISAEMVPEILPDAIAETLPDFPLSESRFTTAATDYCYKIFIQDTGVLFTAGCEIWGSKTTMLDSSGNNITTMLSQLTSEVSDLPDKEAYINTYLNTTFYDGLSENVKNAITPHLFNLGLVKKVSGQTLETDVEQEKSNKWLGKIGLINITDYVKATTSTNNCNSVYTYDGGNCSNNNYIYVMDGGIKQAAAGGSDPGAWTMTTASYANSHTGIWSLRSATGGIGVPTSPGASWGYGVYNDEDSNEETFPVFFLRADIKLKGNGTSTDPYLLVN